MGGDDAPDIVVAGAARSLRQHPEVEFLIYGDEARIGPLLDKHRDLKSAAKIRHTDEIVRSDDKPSVILRKGRRTSMRMAIDAVANGEASAVVSAGNTGALMAMSLFSLRPLPGIDRPAIASFFPTIGGSTCMLDLGANVDSDAHNLVQFAVMGALFVRTVHGIQRPRTALLNVGVEEMKGRDEIKQAAAILRSGNLALDYIGFAEGDDIAEGVADVIVTDGFTGNVALKTAEGVSKLYTAFLKDAFASTPLSKLGYVIARRAMKRVRKRVDPRRYNGAVFLGLNGIAVKSHGGTDEIGFANAVNNAIDMARRGFVESIITELERLSDEGVEEQEAAVS